MSFFSNIFGTTSQPSDAVAAQTAAPVTAATPAVESAPVSPLDQFSSLWEPSATPTVDGTLPANMFSGTDPAKMLEAARKVDFAKSIPPEVLAKITAGGPDAAAAFAQALNDATQRSYAQSSFASTKIVEAALAKFQEGLDSRLPGQIRNHQVSQSLRESNPALMHPAAAPIMEAMQAQLSVKFPKATVSELQGMASQYLTAFNTAANPVKAEKVTAAEDWDSFFK